MDGTEDRVSPLSDPAAYPPDAGAVLVPQVVCTFFIAFLTWAS